MIRPIRLISLLLSLLIVSSALEAAASTRRRAVRVPAPDCGYTLVREHEDPVGEGGITRGVVRVQPAAGAPAECRGWIALSPVEWITIEKATGDPSPAALITVAPNSSAEARSARLTIAGHAYTVVQVGAVPVAPDPNFLRNATFDFDLSHWVWRSDYPNGAGPVTWSSLDANGRIASGSIRLRDINYPSVDAAVQRLQCVPVEPGQRYEYGGAVRAAVPAHGVAAIAVFQYESTDCSGAYTAHHQTNIIRLTAADAWERYTYTQRAGGTAQSIAFIIASAVAESGQPPFDIWFDDLFFRPR